MPWAVVSAAFVGLLVGFAGAGWRGGLVIGALGLLFAAFAAVTSVPRCPACGASLSRLRGERAAANGPGRAGNSPAHDRRCPRCRVAFE